eukprot:m.53810 g.53810  ORF g.53810 m.53810 type:complete len:1703 (+) comp7487_c0_seq1:270-5378(+)
MGSDSTSGPCVRRTLRLPRCVATVLLLTTFASPVVPNDTEARLARCRDVDCNEPISDAKATRPFSTEEDGQVFQAGDVLPIMSKGSDGWWEAKLPNGRRVLFPAQVVNEVTVFDIAPAHEVTRDAATVRGSTGDGDAASDEQGTLEAATNGRDESEPEPDRYPKDCPTWVERQKGCVLRSEWMSKNCATSCWEWGRRQEAAAAAAGSEDEAPAAADSPSNEGGETESETNAGGSANDNDIQPVQDSEHVDTVEIEPVDDGNGAADTIEPVPDTPQASSSDTAAVHDDLDHDEQPATTQDTPDTDPDPRTDANNGEGLTVAELEQKRELERQKLMEGYGESRGHDTGANGDGSENEDTTADDQQQQQQQPPLQGDGDAEDGGDPAANAGHAEYLEEQRRLVQKAEMQRQYEDGEAQGQDDGQGQGQGQGDAVDLITSPPEEASQPSEPEEPLSSADPTINHVNDHHPADESESEAAANEGTTGGAASEYTDDVAHAPTGGEHDVGGYEDSRVEQPPPPPPLSDDETETGTPEQPKQRCLPDNVRPCTDPRSALCDRLPATREILMAKCCSLSDFDFDAECGGGTGGNNEAATNGGSETAHDVNTNHDHGDDGQESDETVNNDALSAPSLEHLDPGGLASLTVQQEEAYNLLWGDDTVPWDDTRLDHDAQEARLDVEIEWRTQGYDARTRHAMWLDRLKANGGASKPESESKSHNSGRAEKDLVKFGSLGQPSKQRSSLCKNPQCSQPLGLGRVKTSYEVNQEGLILSAGETFSILSKGSDGFWDGKFYDGHRRLFPDALIEEIAVFEARPRFTVSGTVNEDGSVTYGDVTNIANDGAAEAAAAAAASAHDNSDHNRVQHAGEALAGGAANALLAAKLSQQEALRLADAADSVHGDKDGTPPVETTDGAADGDNAAAANDNEPNADTGAADAGTDAQQSGGSDTLTDGDATVSADGAGQPTHVPHDDEDNDDDDEEQHWDKHSHHPQGDGSDHAADAGQGAASATTEQRGQGDETVSTTATPTASVSQDGQGPIIDSMPMELPLQDVVAMAPITFSSLLGLNLLFFCGFLFGSGGDKKLEKRYTETLNAKTTLELQLADAEQAKKELEKKISHGQSNDGARIRHAESLVQQTRAEVDQAERNLDAERRRAAEAEAQRDQLQAQLDAQSQQADDLRHQVNQAEAARQALEAELAESKAVTKSARGEVTSLSTQVTSLQNELSKSQVAVTKLEEQLAMRRANEDVAEKYSIAKIALEETQAKLIVAEARAERMKDSEQGDTAKLHDEVQSLKEALDSAEAALKSKSSELERIKSSLRKRGDGSMSASASPTKGLNGNTGQSDNTVRKGSSDDKGSDDDNESETAVEDTTTTSAASPGGDDVDNAGADGDGDLEVLLEAERETRVQLETDLAAARNTVKSLTAELKEVKSRHASELQRVNHTNMELQMRITGIKEIYDQQRETAEKRQETILLDKAKAEDALAVAEDNCRVQEEENQKLRLLLKEQDREAFAKQVERNDALCAEIAMVQSSLDEKKLQLKKAYAQIQELRDELSVMRNHGGGSNPSSAQMRRSLGGMGPPPPTTTRGNVRPKPPPPSTPRPPSLVGGAPVPGHSHSRSGSVRQGGTPTSMGGPRSPAMSDSSYGGYAPPPSHPPSQQQQHPYQHQTPHHAQPHHHPHPSSFSQPPPPSRDSMRSVDSQRSNTAAHFL